MESTEEHSIEAMKPLSAKCNAASFELCAMNTNYGYLAEHLSSPPAPPHLFLPSTSPSLPLRIPLVCCVHSRMISGQVQSQRLQLPGCSWLRMRKTKCKKCTMCGEGRGEGRGGEKRQLWKRNWDSFTQRWLCVDNDLCKVANLISCAPKNAARISTANGKMLTPPSPFPCLYPAW